MTRLKKLNKLFRKRITCARDGCRKRRVVYRPNGKYCSDSCRVQACVRREESKFKPISGEAIPAPLAGLNGSRD